MKKTKLELIIAKAEHECERLECDGTVRVLHYLLTEASIAHTVHLGSMLFESKVIPLHLWIELPDGFIIDIKARRWIKSLPDVPHGLFKKADTKAVYNGQQIKLKMNRIIYQILTETSNN